MPPNCWAMRTDEEIARETVAAHYRVHGTGGQGGATATDIDCVRAGKVEALRWVLDGVHPAIWTGTIRAKLRELEDK